ncbi:MAG: hypothetical protein E6H79_16480 [Betaproteobacteria bacterium]|nr:MAG: hypothetical protein E6H79_16480 [Betaproteobacteria bacterium]
MKRWYAFNGDADGLCALQQLRLVEPARATLVTGVKRDIQLLARVEARAGDEVTVLDVSLDSNRDALRALLDSGARVRYFDHHHAGERSAPACWSTVISTGAIEPGPSRPHSATACPRWPPRSRGRTASTPTAPRAWRAWASR